MFRFEPFLLHAECVDVASAGWLLQAARLAGFRESGATWGGSGTRIMVRVGVQGGGAELGNPFWPLACNRQTFGSGVVHLWQPLGT